MLSIKISKEPFLVCKDHTVSGKKFELRKAEELDLLITFPRPENDQLPSYYKSEKYISHTDSKNNFIDKAYQQVKSLMLKRKIRWIEKEVLQKGKILDVGAGTGDFLIQAKKSNWETFGVEPNFDAKERALQKGVNLVENSYSFPNGQFDVITMWHVLEHVPDLEKQIKELDRLLKPDGLLVIAVPNFKSYDAEEYKEFWAAYDVPRHLYHFSPEAIKKIFQTSGFTLTSQKGLFFDSFYVSLLSEKYRSGKSNLLRPLKVGAVSNYKAMRTKNYSSLAYFFRKQK